MATDSPFQVWINGHRVQVDTLTRSVLATGSWFVQGPEKTLLNTALEGQPERLDPDEIATLLPGQHDQDRNQVIPSSITRPQAKRGSGGQGKKERSSRFTA